METTHESTETTNTTNTQGVSETTAGSEAQTASPQGSATGSTGAMGSGSTEGVSSAEAAGAGNDGAALPGSGETAAGKQDSSAYTPSFKFKVKDKELEFDDFIKPIVKTKDLETKIREIYEKAHGLDEVKSAREAVKSQMEEWKSKYSQVETSLQTLGKYVEKGDYKTFFQALNIPKEKIIQYAIEELKYQELPPEQRAAIDMQRERELALEQTHMQNQSLQQQMAQLIQQQTTFELSQEIAKPEVAQVSAAYDARTGKQGSFMAEVIRRGQYYEAVHKVSPPASQLVQEVLSLIGAQQSPQGAQNSSQGQPGQVVQTQQQKPTIPSFSGGGTKSPARRVPSSLDDLRKMRQNLTT